MSLQKYLKAKPFANKEEKVKDPDLFSSENAHFENDFFKIFVIGACSYILADLLNDSERFNFMKRVKDSVKEFKEFANGLLGVLNFMTVAEVTNDYLNKVINSSKKNKVPATDTEDILMMEDSAHFTVKLLRMMFMTKAISPERKAEFIEDFTKMEHKYFK